MNRCTSCLIQKGLGTETLGVFWSQATRCWRSALTDVRRRHGRNVDGKALAPSTISSWSAKPANLPSWESTQDLNSITDNWRVFNPTPKIVDSFQKEFDKLGSALNSGDLMAARSAYEALLKLSKKTTAKLAVAPPNCSQTQRICRFE